MVKNKIAIKYLFKLFRLLHIYCSTLLFTLFVFFSITGITLNHRLYDSESNEEFTSEIAIDTDLIAALTLNDVDGNWAPDLNSILRFLKSEHQVESPSSIGIDRDMREVIIEYRAPASFASAILNADEGILTLEKEMGSTLGILNDLHKGRHSGIIWRWLIDVSAILMLVFSISGLVILYQGKKYRRSGTCAVIVGTLSPIFLYFFLTPHI